MPHAPQPHTPDGELAARGAQAEAPDDVLTPDLEAFCQGGVSVIFAVSRPGDPPFGGIGCGCRILPGGRMRLLIQRPGNERALELAATGARIAATYSQPITHRSIQVKGARSAVVTPTEEDRQAALRQLAGLNAELVEIEYTHGFADAYCALDPDNLAAIEFEMEAAYVQTPGPGAGAELRP